MIPILRSTVPTALNSDALATSKRSVTMYLIAIGHASFGIKDYSSNVTEYRGLCFITVSALIPRTSRGIALGELATSGEV